MKTKVQSNFFKGKALKYYPLIALIKVDFPVPLSPVMPNRILTFFHSLSFFLRNSSMPETPFLLIYALASARYSSVRSVVSSVSSLSVSSLSVASLSSDSVSSISSENFLDCC